MDPLINISDNSELTFSNAYIDHNEGGSPIFNVYKNCSLILVECLFQSNVSYSSEIPSCIKSDCGSSVNMQNCEFKNHQPVNPEYPFSVLISTKGNLKIHSTEFVNNKSNSFIGHEEVNMITIQVI